MLKCQNTRKRKGPKLLLNKSIHTLPSKVTYSTAEFKRANLNPKLVTAAIGKPQFNGIQGHLGSKRNNKLLWRLVSNYRVITGKYRSILWFLVFLLRYGLYRGKDGIIVRPLENSG